MPKEHQARGFPCVWAVRISTVGTDASVSLAGYFAGHLDEREADYIGAQQATSMTAEMAAQVWTGIYFMQPNQQLPSKCPLRVVYDNETAAKFAQSVATAQTNVLLQTVSATVWQITSMRRQVGWSHTYSHKGDPYNNLVDEIVASASYSTICRCNVHTPIADWCTHYDVNQK